MGGSSPGLLLATGLGGVWDDRGRREVAIGSCFQMVGAEGFSGLPSWGRGLRGVPFPLGNFEIFEGPYRCNLVQYMGQFF